MAPSLGRGRRPVVLAIAVATTFLAACSPAGQAGAGADTTARAASRAGWESLFDGRTLDRWRGYKRADVPGNWQAQDGTLAFVPGPNGGDLMTREEFDNFELSLEWKVSPGGNSGVIYRVSEDYNRSYETGPEMQILDNTRHGDGKNPLTSAGSNYALDPPVADVTRPVGEWNEARLVARGRHVEHWLNGRKLVEYEQGGERWKQQVAASKFRSMPGYGKNLRGHIVLQDHGDPVWFRNIRIRRLPAN